MRITHVTDTMEIGGLETMVLALAKQQKRIGMQVSIICVYQDGALAQAARESGIEVFPLRRMQTGFFRTVFNLARQIRKLRPQIIHSHNSVGHYFSVAAKCLLLASPLMINTRHDMGLQLHANRRPWLFSLTRRYTDHFVSVCEAARTVLSTSHGISPNKIRVIPNGIDLEKFKPQFLQKSIEVRAALKIDSNSMILITVGRLVPLKAHARLLLALKDVLAKHSIVWLVVGDGPERDRLQTITNDLKLNERVRFLGQTSDVPALLAASDIFVLPSDTEGYSMALVEAAASGLPCIARTVGGNAEIIQDGITGALDSSADLSGTVSAVVDLLHNNALRKKQGQAARQWAQKNASIEVMTNRYSALYKQVHF
jgi:glycosyltransferase involved in cell wall biosynthesis